MAAAAHGSSGIFVGWEITLFLKVGSRGLEEERKRTVLIKANT